MYGFQLCGLAAQLSRLLQLNVYLLSCGQTWHRFCPYYVFLLNLLPVLRNWITDHFHPLYSLNWHTYMMYEVIKQINMGIKNWKKPKLYWCKQYMCKWKLFSSHPSYTRMYRSINSWGESPLAYYNGKVDIEKNNQIKFFLYFVYNINLQFLHMDIFWWIFFDNIYWVKTMLVMFCAFYTYR